jgi:hypothetical protein
MSALLLALVLAAAPPDGPWASCGPGCHRLTVPQGIAQVQVACPRLDLPLLRSAVLHAYARGRAERADVEPLPLDVAVLLTPDVPTPYDGLHRYHPSGGSTIRLRCDRERVLEHELFHRFASQLAHRGSLDCDLSRIHHAHGKDLRCADM